MILKLGEKQGMYRRVGGQFRMEGCRHMQTLFDQDRGFLIVRQYFDVRSCVADDGGADEYGFYFLRLGAFLKAWFRRQGYDAAFVSAVKPNGCTAPQRLP